MKSHCEHYFRWWKLSNNFDKHLIGSLFCVCLWVFVYVCSGGVCVCAPVAPLPHAGIYGGQILMSGCLPNLTFGDNVSPWNWSSLILRDWLAADQGASVLTFPTLDIQMTTTAPVFFFNVGGSDLNSVLHTCTSSIFTNWVIFQIIFP